MTPGLDVRLARGRMRDQVLHATNRRQEPFVYGSLGGAELPLVPGKPAEPAPAAPVASTPPAVVPSAALTGEAERSWDRIKDTTDIATLAAFVRRFGDPFYSDLASQRFEIMKGKAAEEQRIAMLHKQKAEEAAAIATKIPSWSRMQSDEEITIGAAALQRGRLARVPGGPSGSRSRSPSSPGTRYEQGLH